MDCLCLAGTAEVVSINESFATWMMQAYTGAETYNIIGPTGKSHPAVATVAADTRQHKRQQGTIARELGMTMKQQMHHLVAQECKTISTLLHCDSNHIKREGKPMNNQVCLCNNTRSLLTASLAGSSTASDWEY